MRSLSAEERGISPVVATLLLLSIFIGVFAIYMTITVPGEFASREKEHMSEVQDSFLGVQSAAQELSAGESKNITVSMSANLVSGIFRGPGIGGRLNVAETSLISQSTVGLWLIDEGSGTQVKDSSPNNNHGTIYGGVAWTTGKYGSKGLNFPGSSGSYVFVPNSSSLNKPGGFSELSVETWVYVNGSQNAGILSTRKGWLDGWYMKVETTGDPNKFKYVVAMGLTGGGGGDGWGIGIDNAAPINQWVHLAFTYSSLGPTLKLYVNGVATPYDTWWWPGSGNVEPGENLSMGREQGDSSWFNGKMDEVRIENRVLKDSEIAERAKRGTLYYEIQNAYYPPQIYVYEHGAVIMLQPPENKSVMVSPPPMIEVTPYGAGDNIRVRLQTIQLMGSGEVTGTGTETLTVAVESSLQTSTPSQPNAENVRIVIHSDYKDAWRDYLVGLVEQLRNDGIYAALDSQNLELTIHGKSTKSGVNDIYLVRELKDVSITIS